MDRGAPQVRLKLATYLDLELLYAWRQDRAIVRYMPGTPKKMTWEHHLSWWGKVQQGSIHCWIVLFPDDKEDPAKFRLVGTVHEDQRSHEVGVLIGERDLWGRGIAKAALQELLFKVQDRPLYAVIHPKNTRSQKLFHGLGFKKMEGEWRRGQEVWRLE